MPAIWNSVRARWRVALAVVVMGSCAALFDRYLEMRANYDLCDLADPHRLSGPGGDAIEMETRFCGLLAGDPGTIVIRFRPAGSGRGRIIFAYNPSSNEPGSPSPPWYPTIAWTSPNRILISISRISQVQRQLFAEGDMRFAYRIGMVDYPHLLSPEQPRRRPAR